jgi:predicted O-methyltransferase YrrM
MHGAYLDNIVMDEYDYVSPGLLRFDCDPFFPEMVIGDRKSVEWVHFRRSIPHCWYVDRRYPNVGFLNRDEAAVLASNAQIFSGQRALEIGTWRGWSACHLAMAGVVLDVIDPLLADTDLHDEIALMLRKAGVLERVTLHPALSPDEVTSLGLGGARWSLVFVDGDHEAPAPVEDTLACLPFLTDDAMFLFHDLMSPDVAEALAELRGRGWSTLVYQTSQIMGVAWRGSIEPAKHTPDPKLEWNLPAHLHSFVVSGEPPAATAARFATLIDRASRASLLA